jgi:hypothetical protein
MPEEHTKVKRIEGGQFIIHSSNARGQTVLKCLLETEFQRDVKENR